MKPKTLRPLGSGVKLRLTANSSAKDVSSETKSTQGVGLTTQAPAGEDAQEVNL